MSIRIIILVLTCASSAQAAKLGLGGGLGKVDAKVAKVEMDLLRAVNNLRKKKKLDPLRMDDALRTLVRQQAELGARGDPAAKTFDMRVKTRKLAPHGYRVQYVFGKRAKDAFTNIKKVPEALEALYTEYGRIGIGAFLVPEDKPYYQVAIIVAAEPDPMAGKPGLTREQTDPPMKQAAATIKTVCYDDELRNDPNLSGNLVFQIVIGDKGQVASAKLLSGTEMRRFNDCALRVVSELTFPAPYKGKPVTLNHPMRFVPPQGAKRIGRLTPAQVANVFRMTQHNFKRCYDDRVKEKPGLRGKMQVALTINADGSLKEVQVAKDGPNDPELTKCVLGLQRSPDPDKFSGVSWTKCVNA